MNTGVYQYPKGNVQPLQAGVFAYLKMNLSGYTSAADDGKIYPASVISASYNIRHVVYNSTGDITVRFTEAADNENFAVFATAKAVTAGNSCIIGIHESDANSASEKRFFVMRGSDAAEQNATEIHLVFLS